MNRRTTGLFAAVLLALVGTLMLVGWVRSAEARALEGEKLVDVFVVKDAVAAGTRAEDLTDKVEIEQVPAKIRAEDAVVDLDDLKGKLATVDLVPGEQLVATRFGEAVARDRAGVPSGLLEVTVKLDPERALGGKIAAGDTVAVVASLNPDVPDDAPSITHLMLHKVLVTAVQVDEEVTKSDDDEVAPAGSLLVTLAVDAPSVERIVFAAEYGGIWLSAEPKEAPEGGTKVINGSNLFA